MKGRGNLFSVDHKIYPIGEGVTIICWFNPLLQSFTPKSCLVFASFNLL